MNYTKQQLEGIGVYEKALKTSLSGYIVMSASEKRNLFKIAYGPDWDHVIRPNTVSCGYCSLKEVRKIADRYYADIKELEDGGKDNAEDNGK